VVTLDEATKDTTTTAERDQMLSILGEPPAQQPSYQVSVPILVVVGEYDKHLLRGRDGLRLRQRRVGAQL
jgi:hypothetical protein